MDNPTSAGGPDALQDVTSIASQSVTDVPADSSVSQPTNAFLQNSEQQAVAYGFLSATSLAFGVAALAAPQVLLSVVFGGRASLLDTAFTRIAGATMAISAAAEYSIRVSWIQASRETGERHASGRIKHVYMAIYKMSVSAAPVSGMLHCSC